MTILDEICDKKRAHVVAQKSKVSLDTLKSLIKDAPPPRGFFNALKNNSPNAIIAEIKKASPSAGIISKNFDPASIAQTYQTAGASCLSVLTDIPYFQGHDEFLTQARIASTLPILRKDFIVDEYQIYESRALAADCILLIMASLTDTEAANFHALAKNLGMDVLVEIHDEEECERALKLNPEIIGVNNRNLKTMHVDLQTSITVATNIPDTVFKISESGIKSAADMQTLQAIGYKGFLIGESLMRDKNTEKTLKSWLTQSKN